MSANAYMEQPSYPAHYGAGAISADRSAPIFAAESHEPRAPRPFEAIHHTASNDPYGNAALPAAHSQAGTMAEAHSPMSSYRGSFSHNSSMGLPHHRQESISSISSPHDITGGWAPSSPGLTASRHASIYSLNGQFDQVGLGSSIDSGSTSGHFYDQSPPLHAQVRYAQGQAADARRFSLDDRAIRTQPQLGKSGLVSADYQVPGSSGRHWPWGASSSSAMHGRHASVSAAPPNGYDHSRMAGYGANNASIPPTYGYDANAMSAMSPTRYRSMSSSAASGRAYGNPYGAPGTATHAVAAMGYGMAPHLAPGMMLEGDIPGGPGPARRAKFKRSRTGCLVCRKRKVKCSQDGNPCKQCRIGKRDCHYDENPQKKKSTKKERSTGSIDGGSCEKGSSDGAAPALAHIDPQTNGHSIHSNADPYYGTMPGLDHRTDSNGSNGGVTFSMPFSNTPAPVSAHSGTTDSTWSNPSPFGAPGPHGESHPEMHQVGATHQDGYGWPSKQEHDPSGAYPNGMDRNSGYWSQQHPTAYPGRSGKLEVSDS
ncbi:uncharacterized protein MEPE_02439 [Melanopsichium pennsylvanicum]|uniref:Zn(2)-C6 fungal-type domain-containing protein n=2 Tax=Melanopsichium pennsylvanicum TaxID=63383 RepID=A0AAJ5C4K1_9BASI|nr:hypothetical protein BN887_01282 [Melanopsichium pennsylvanicum 4]SNX83732.1 uncharacterized protein MEPE_02439 [Melanopsichium pennsylvanicum]